MKAFYFVVILSGLLLAGCGPSAEQLTATAVMARAQTQTAAPTFTPTHTPTVTLTPTVTITVTPTSTRTPAATATPASLGETVQFSLAKLELNVQWAETHTQIVPGGRYFYTPAKGHTFIELGILISNIGDKPYNCTMNDIRLINDSGDSRSAGFGVLTTVNLGTNVNTAGLKIPADPLDRDQKVSFKNGKYTYMRLIFHILTGDRFTFRILNSPPITFTIKK